MSNSDNQMIFGYRGLVKLKLKINDNIIELEGHNAGTQNLFHSFAKYLAGYLNFSDIPRYIDLRACSSASEVLTAESLLSRLVEVNRNYTASIEAEQYATFRGEISSNNISPPTAPGLHYYICLTNEVLVGEKKEKIVYAYMEIPADAIEGLFGAVGIAAIVEWQMRLQNI